MGPQCEIFRRHWNNARNYPIAKVRGVKGVFFLPKMHKGNVQVKVGGKLQMVALKVVLAMFLLLARRKKILIGKLEDLNIKKRSNYWPAWLQLRLATSRNAC